MVYETEPRPDGSASFHPSFADELAQAFGVRARADVPLGPLTTFRTGGPADWLVETHGRDEILIALELASKWHVPVTLLGGGSNVLVSDAGVRGLVIRPRHGAVAALGPSEVSADAATTINGLVRWTIGRGLAGLEAWTGTPGTVGGGVFGNAHFRGRLLSEQIVRVQLASRDGRLSDVPSSAMEFGYDHSRLQRTGEVLISAIFAVTPGSPEALRRVARESLAFRKRTQPLDVPSAGCIFQNPAPSDPVPAEIPRSAGALIDRAGLKGKSLGAAQVSPTHGNFIITEGPARSRDIRALIDLCRREVAARFGVQLREEIQYLGDFD